jgi:hypothetical protein
LALWAIVAVTTQLPSPRSLTVRVVPLIEQSSSLSLKLIAPSPAWPVVVRATVVAPAGA